MKARTNLPKTKGYDIPRDHFKAFERGLEIGRAEGLISAFNTHKYTFLPAMYNAKDDDIISDEYLGVFSRKVDVELQRILDFYFDNDICKVQAIVDEKKENRDDRIGQLILQIYEIQKRCGLHK